MKAPVGPPIWTLLPPRSEIRKPATMAVTSPALGSAPAARPTAMLNGRAVIAIVGPASASPASTRHEQSRMVVRGRGFTLPPLFGGAAPFHACPGGRAQKAGEKEA